MGEKIVLLIEKKLLKFEAEFAKNLRSLEQIFRTVGQNNFGNKIPILEPLKMVLNFNLQKSIHFPFIK